MPCLRGNERRYLDWRIGHGETLWPFRRDRLFSADLLRSFFLIERFPHPRPACVLLHGQGSVILSGPCARASEISRPLPIDCPAGGYFFRYGVLRNIRPDLDRDGICSRHLSALHRGWGIPAEVIRHKEHDVFRLPLGAGDLPCQWGVHPSARFFQRPTESSIAILSVLIGVPFTSFSSERPSIRTVEGLALNKPLHFRHRHPGESRGPGDFRKAWIPAFAGMTAGPCGKVAGYKRCNTYFETTPE